MRRALIAAGITLGVLIAASGCGTPEAKATRGALVEAGSVRFDFAVKLRQQIGPKLGNLTMTGTAGYLTGPHRADLQFTEFRWLDAGLISVPAHLIIDGTTGYSRVAPAAGSPIGPWERAPRGDLGGGLGRPSTPPDGNIDLGLLDPLAFLPRAEVSDKFWVPVDNGYNYWCSLEHDSKAACDNTVDLGSLGDLYSDGELRVELGLDGDGRPEKLNVEFSAADQEALTSVILKVSMTFHDYGEPVTIDVP